jgi:hypothetical protein
MRTRWSVAAVLLSVPSLAAPPTVQGEAERTPPAAQQSILPLHAVGFSFGLGVEFKPSGSDDANGLLNLNVAWSPLDWLEISFLLPGASVLLGTRNEDEVVLSAGLDGIGYGSVEGFIFVPSVGAAYRHWFSAASSLGVTARWASQYSKAAAQPELAGSVFVTHTFGQVVSINLAIGGAGWPSDSSGLTFGSARLGVRSLPLIRVQLSPVWSIDLDARLTLRLQPSTATAEQVVLGFSAIW